MMQDTRLVDLLRSAVPPVVTTGPSRDLWPLVVKCGRQHRRWRWFDVGLAAGAAIVLSIRADLLMFLAYYF